MATSILKICNVTCMITKILKSFVILNITNIYQYLYTLYDRTMAIVPIVKYTADLI